MSNLKYKEQARLLIDVLPEIAAVDCFAMHGGSAINLFVRDMLRLSVDIDLTYLPIEDRNVTLSGIERGLKSISRGIAAKHPAIQVTEDIVRAKLYCVRQRVQIKIEVNTTMRGSLLEPELVVL